MAFPLPDLCSRSDAHAAAIERSDRLLWAFLRLIVWGWLAYFALQARELWG